MRLSQVIKQTIDLAGQSRDYWARELPKRYPNYPIVPSEDDSLPSPPQDAELRSLFDGLPPDTIYAILLVMYLGRGDFRASDLESNLARVRKTFPHPQWAAAQMLSKASLADYLADGLAELKKANMDVDSLRLDDARLNAAAG